MYGDSGKMSATGGSRGKNWVMMSRKVRDKVTGKRLDRSDEGTRQSWGEENRRTVNHIVEGSETLINPRQG